MLCMGSARPPPREGASLPPEVGRGAFCEVVGWGSTPPIPRNWRSKWWGETPPYTPILIHTPQNPKRRNAASALFLKFLFHWRKPAAKHRNFDLSTGNPQDNSMAYPQENHITFNIFLAGWPNQMPTLIQRKRAHGKIIRSNQTLSSGTQRSLRAGAGRGRERIFPARII